MKHCDGVCGDYTMHWEVGIYWRSGRYPCFGDLFMMDCYELTLCYTMPALIRCITRVVDMG